MTSGAPAAAAPGVPVAALPAESEAEHLQRLRALCPGAEAAAPSSRRSGSSWQQPRRRLEQQVRQQAVAFRQWVAAYGLNRIESAANLGIAVRTLRDWEQRLDSAAAAAPRGRPVVRSARAARTAVLELLASVGPGVGLAVLAGQFSGLPKAELADMLRRYRHVWRCRHPQLLHVLHWQQPGTVWAIDYARAPLPLEEGFTDLLAVRDLASGMQLLWLPVAEATAATTTAALLALFALHGAPLVLKLDNGSPFVATATQALLTQWQVIALYSPPGRPQYNGSIEAGIGALKVRTHYQAVRQGRPGAWTLEDAEAARQEANTLGRPWGADKPTPAERWLKRSVVTAAQRQEFAAAVAAQEEALAPAAAAATAATSEPTAVPAPAAPEPADGVAPSSERREAAAPGPHPAVTSGAEPAGAATSATAAEGAARRRQAISRALVAHGYLAFTRRRIPPPIRKKKVT